MTILLFSREVELFRNEQIQCSQSIQPGCPQGRERSQLCLCCSRNESTGLLKAWPKGCAATYRGFCSWESSPGNTPTSLPCPKDELSLANCLSLPYPHFLSHFLCKQNLLLSTSLCSRAESLGASFSLPLSSRMPFCLPSRSAGGIVLFSSRNLAFNLGSLDPHLGP